MRSIANLQQTNLVVFFFSFFGFFWLFFFILIGLLEEKKTYQFIVTLIIFRKRSKKGNSTISWRRLWGERLLDMRDNKEHQSELPSESDGRRVKFIGRPPKFSPLCTVVFFFFFFVIFVCFVFFNQIIDQKKKESEEMKHIFWKYSYKI